MGKKGSNPPPPEGLIKPKYGGNRMAIIEIGDIARDKVTGYSGVVIGHTKWLNGCDRIGIRSKKLKDGKPQGAEWFDEMEIEVLEKNVVDFDIKRVPQTKIKMGDRVRDKVTETEGIVTAITIYVDNPVNYGIQNEKLNEDGKPVDLFWVGPKNITLIKEDAIGVRREKTKETKPPGGPRRDPNI